jgi:3',5'-cyclic AMP phosphodiesterase CpdA
MLIAQISDLHVRLPGKLLYGALDTGFYAARAVAAVAACRPRPDLVLVTGDLVEAGAPQEYAYLREILSGLPMPYRLIPGNHDARPAMRAVFTDHTCLGTDGFIQYVEESYPVRLIGLDSLDEGHESGRLCDQRLGWLDTRLAAAPDRPTLIFVHHPPFLTGMPHFDGQALAGAAAFAAIIARYPNIERVVSGHVHRPMQARWAGTLATTCPSSAHQFALDLTPGDKLDYILEAPGYQLHAWHAGRLVTHTVPIADHERRKLV